MALRRQSRRRSRPKSPNWFLILGLLGAVFLIWNLFSPYGLLRYYQLKARVVELSQEVALLRQDCQDLKQRITLLKSDRTYIEKVARQRYGLVKNNEILYQFPQK